MLKVVKQCAPWLNWKNAGIAALVAVGLVICTGMPNLSILAGVAPLLLIVACLVPCLAPLILLRRKNRAQAIRPFTRQHGQEADQIDNSPDASQGEHTGAETARL
jgi:hypothetical protein